MTDRATISIENISSSFRSQYLSSLQMLHNIIEITPDNLWNNKNHISRSWQVAYHALYYYRLYICQDLQQHVPWEKHKEGAQDLHPNKESLSPYAREQLLTLIRLCIANLDSDLSQLDLSAAQSGFPWYKISKLEHQLVNLRHLQHHVAQLQDRLRNEKQMGIGWIRSEGHLTRLQSE
ncbi:MAG: hypothetical protein HKN87_12075 [Saprospiraceae bacterium]|nr:hypothetical protein [Saprospiraceae bacterium]